MAKRIRKPLTAKQQAERRIRRKSWKQYSVLNVSRSALAAIKRYCKATNHQVGPWCEERLMVAVEKAMGK